MLSGTGCSIKKSENQLYSHTSPHYDRAVLQKAIYSKLLDNAPTLKSHYCRKSEDTHMHARKKKRLLSATKHFPDCSIKTCSYSHHGTTNAICASNSREKTCQLKTGKSIATRKTKLKWKIPQTRN